MSLQVGTLNRKTALFLAGAVLFVLWRFGIFSSSGTATVTAVESPSMAEKRLAILRAKAAEVPGREAVLKKAMSEVQASEKGILDAPTAAQAQAQLLEIIHRVAAANGFDAKGVDSIPQPRPLGSDYGEVMVTETFTCAIDQLVNFLAALANEPQIIATNEIQITGGNDKKKNIQVRLSLSGVVPKRLVPEKKGVAAF